MTWIKIINKMKNTHIHIPFNGEPTEGTLSEVTRLQRKEGGSIFANTPENSELISKEIKSIKIFKKFKDFNTK